MFSYRVAFAAVLAPLFAVACSAERSETPAAEESEVRASSCKSFITFEGSADAGLRADLRAALGQPANDDAVSMPGVLRVGTKDGKDVVSFYQSSWGFEEGAFTFPSQTFDHVASRALYDGMKKAKETFENDGEIVVRTSPKGRVVCRLYVGLNDPDESEYVCSIPGLTGGAPAPKDCSETITFEGNGPNGLRKDLLAALGSDDAVVAGAIEVDDADTVQLMGTTSQFMSDARERAMLVFPAANAGDSDAAAKKLYDAMKKAPESKDGDATLRTSADGLVQCSKYPVGAKSRYHCQIRKWQMTP